MQAVVVERIGEFALREVPVPRPGPGEVLVKVAVTGLCRTDLKLIRVGHRDLLLPRIPGEEVVGQVYRCGPGVAAYAPGQRVYVYPGTSCGRCGPCLAGATNLCRTMEIMGFHRDGGFGEYVLAPAASLIPLPEGLADDEAVFAEPLSCCLNALERAGLRAGERIAIWGAGPAGTLLARAAAALQARPLLVEPDPRRRPAALGQEAPPEEPVDVAVVAVGDREAYGQALSCLGPRGRLVVFSGLPPEGAGLPVDFNRFHYGEQGLVGAYGCAYRHGEQALAWIAAGRVPVQDLVSHRLPLAALEEALARVAQRTCMKILLYPGMA
jgi:L-iditol 2-dehydrogenase